MATRISVSAIATTPVKGLRIDQRPEGVVEQGGLRGDRRFYLVDDRGRMVNGKHSGALNEVRATLEEQEGERRILTLTFPDGAVVSGETQQLGQELQTRFFSRPRQARLIEGPFSAALSEHVGESLRLVVAADGSSAVDRGAQGALSVISRASLAALAREGDVKGVDGRRFRMSIELEGARAFEEDEWMGREVRIGRARVAVSGHVGRCIVTSRHPETGVVDLPTLDLLRTMRVGAVTTEPLALGVFSSVLEGGPVKVGDGVELL
jgi:uncharacterized protein